VIMIVARCRFSDPMVAPSTDLPDPIGGEACATGKGACRGEG
jgi:hypothetical protein